MKPSSLSLVHGATLEAKLRELLRLHDELYIQEKFNGIGFRMSWGGQDVMRTTRGKLWPENFFPPEIRHGLIRMQAGFHYQSVLYGEIIAADPGVPLATLAGAVNVNSPAADPSIKLRAMVYDVQEPGFVSFESRQRRLANYTGAGQLKATGGNVMAVPTYRHSDPLAIIREYNEVVADGGEGLILRSPTCFFCDGVSPAMWKMKRLREAEGVCVSIEEGKGKRRGMLGAMYLRLDTTSEILKLGGGPGMTDELLTRLYTNPPIGLPVTFTYEELSVNNLPLRPQFKAVRNYE